MIEKLECTCVEAYTARKMRDPNCCACSCDHNDLVEQLAKANERIKRLELIAKGLCYTEGTVRGDKAYADWCEYQEQLRKEQE